MDNQFISFGLGFILSIALFTAFKGWRGSEVVIFELELEKLKQKTEALLKNVWNNYCNTTGRDRQLPEGLSFNNMIELFIGLDENIKEKILALNQINLDLINNGVESDYFINILNVYGLY